MLKKIGKLAKTDKIDAQIIATYGETVEPEATVLASETEQEMKAWLQRRQQLKEMIIAEKNRQIGKDGQRTPSMNTLNG